MSAYDIAICYFGLPRSVKHVHQTHKEHLFSVLDAGEYTYKKFMHSWTTADGKQRVWRYNAREKIDSDEYKLLEPDVYAVESQDEFMNGISMSDYYYEAEKKREWDRVLLKNHVCALGSERRVLQMVRASGDTFKYIMVVRPDAQFIVPIPLPKVFPIRSLEFVISDHRHYEGFNDRFMVSNAVDAHIYMNRLDEMKESRATCGRITAEKYLKDTFKRHGCTVKKIPFPFNLVRPDGGTSDN
jgi:hypothetical protein